MIISQYDTDWLSSDDIYEPAGSSENPCYKSMLHRNVAKAVKSER